MEPPALEELYDPAVLQAIDGDSAALRRAERSAVAHPDSIDETTPRRQTRRPGLGGAAASVALTTALVTGVREALEPEANEVYEEIDDGVVGGPTEAVTLFFVPNNPWATRAVIRPWLFPALAESGAAS